MTLPQVKASVCVILKNRVRNYQFLKRLNWKRSSHHNDCGGATTSTYQIGMNDQLFESWNTTNNQETRWELKDFVDVAVGGQNDDPPMESPRL